jgi:hypothetical protein
MAHPDTFGRGLFQSVKNCQINNLIPKHKKGCFRVAPINKYYFWNLITVEPDDNKFVDCAIGTQTK